MIRLVTTLLTVLLVTSASVFGGDLPELSERSTSASGNNSGSTTETPTQQTTKLLTQNMTTTSSTKKETPSQFESVFFIIIIIFISLKLWTRLIDYYNISLFYLRKMFEKIVLFVLH